MNKLSFLFLILIFSFGFFSCSKGQVSTSVKQPLPQILASDIDSKVPQKKWDFDFTKMNFTLASGVMFEFLLQPEDCEGKSVLIKGQYHTEVYQNQRLFSVFIWDATGCCPQSLTFIPPESFVFPDDFPREKQEITLYGILQKVTFGDGEELNLIAEDIIF